MKLLNIQKYKIDSIDCQISAYYDNELNISNLMNFEARMLYSDVIHDYVNTKCRENYIISQSIRMVKKRCGKKAEIIANEFIEKLNSKKSVFDFYSAFFKSINKLFSDILLNINRYDS